MTKYTKSEVADAIAELRTMLRPGDTVFTNLKHVSKSGMMRIIQPIIMQVDIDRLVKSHDYQHAPVRYTNLSDGEINRRYIGWLVAKALEEPSDGDQGVKMGGAGMDMGFALVYALSHKLFPEGFDCIGDGCPSNDHSNVRYNACAVCGKVLERQHYRTVAEMDSAETREAYKWLIGGSGLDWYGSDPKHKRKNRGHDAACCSRACATGPWHHSSGGYALNHKWL